MDSAAVAAKGTVVARGRLYAWFVSPDNMYKAFAGVFVFLALAVAATTAAFVVVREAWTIFAGFAAFVALLIALPVTLAMSRAAGGLERTDRSLIETVAQQRAESLGPEADPSRFNPWASTSFIMGFVTIWASLGLLAVALGVTTAAFEDASDALLSIALFTMLAMLGIVLGVALFRRSASGR